MKYLYLKLYIKAGKIYDHLKVIVSLYSVILLKIQVYAAK